MSGRDVVKEAQERFYLRIGISYRKLIKVAQRALKQQNLKTGKW